MKKAVVVVLVLFLAAGVAYAKGYEVRKKAGEYDVIITFDRNPPVASDNAVSIAVKDASGKNVKDVQVKVEYTMPAMPGMPAMNYKTDAALQGDEYKAVMGLSMSGSWNVAIKITRAGKTSTMKFTVDAK
jgi:YtkA-like